MYIFYWPFFIINRSQRIRFLILIQVNIYFLLIFFIIIEVNVYFFIDLFFINRGQCIFFIDFFWSLTQANVFFLLNFFIINRGQQIFFICHESCISSKKLYIYTLACTNDKKINKNILSSIIGEVKKAVFFFHKHILSLKHAKLRYF